MDKTMKAIVFGTLTVLAAIVLIFSPRPTGAQTAKPVTERGERINVLLLGCDESGLRTDSIMLVGADSGTGQVTMLSLPRDSKVRFNDRTRKLNSALVYGDIGLLLDTVEELTGVPIDYYIRIKTGVFADIVDALGGVEYTVEQDMRYSDPEQDLYIDLKAGTQTLSGAQCEQYCRYRRYLMGDYTRAQKQRELLSALVRQKLNIGSLAKLPALYNIIKENAETNITPADVAGHIGMLRMLIGKELNIETLDTPGAYNEMEIEGVSYYLVDREALQSLCQSHFRTF